MTVLASFFFAPLRLRDSKRIYHKVTKDTKNHEERNTHALAVIAVFAVVKNSFASSASLAFQKNIDDPAQ
jgi:hypothetical protein